MTINHENIFHLLQLGIRGKSTFKKRQTDLTTEEWEETIKESMMHAVSPTVFDGMTALTREEQPPKAMIYQWFASVQNTEMKNKKLNSVLKKLTNVMNNGNIQFIMMKGQGAAQRYPNPLHRCSGDIDILILNGQFDKATDMLCSEGATITEIAPEKHTTLIWHGAVIELHHTIIDLCYPKAYKVMNNAGYNSMNTFVEIDGGDNEPMRVPVLEPAYELVYQLTHILHHLLTEGIGLRQVCDFALSMDALDETKIDGVNDLLKQTHLTRFFAALAYICTTRLGCDANKWLWTENYLDRELAEELIEVIMNYGNFGCKTKEKVSDKTLWGNIQNARLYTKRCTRFYPLIPDEVKWFLIIRTKRWIAKKMRRPTI